MPAPIRRHVLPYSFARSGFLRQGSGRSVQPLRTGGIAERKRKRHNIHADLVCRHRIGSLFGAMIAVIIKPIRMKTCSKNTLYPTLTRLMNAAIVGLILFFRI